MIERDGFEEGRLGRQCRLKGVSRQLVERTRDKCDDVGRWIVWLMISRETVRHVLLPSYASAKRHGAKSRIRLTHRVFAVLLLSNAIPQTTHASNSLNCSGATGISCTTAFTFTARFFPVPATADPPLVALRPSSEPSASAGVVCRYRFIPSDGTAARLIAATAAREVGIGPLVVGRAYLNRSRSTRNPTGGGSSVPELSEIVSADACATSTRGTATGTRSTGAVGTTSITWTSSSSTRRSALVRPLLTPRNRIESSPLSLRPESVALALPLPSPPLALVRFSSFRFLRLSR